MALLMTNLQVFVADPNLKITLEKYAENQNTSVSALISQSWEKLLSSRNLSLKVKTFRHDSADKGISAKEHQVATRINISVPINLVNKVDKAIEIQKEKAKDIVINRNLFNLEAIRRYIEPDLIENGYLNETIFKDDTLAVKNIIAIREKLGLNQKEFYQMYFVQANGLKPVISYPQYALIERTGRGNVTRILSYLSEKFRVDHDSFYLPMNDFIRKLNV